MHPRLVNTIPFVAASDMDAIVLTATEDLAIEWEEHGRPQWQEKTIADLARSHVLSYTALPASTLDQMEMGLKTVATERNVEHVVELFYEWKRHATSEDAEMDSDDDDDDDGTRTFGPGAMFEWMSSGIVSVIKRFGGDDGGLSEFDQQQTRQSFRTFCEARHGDAGPSVEMENAVAPNAEDNRKALIRIFTPMRFYAAQQTVGESGLAFHVSIVAWHHFRACASAAHAMLIENCYSTDSAEVRLGVVLARQDAKQWASNAYSAARLLQGVAAEGSASSSRTEDTASDDDGGGDAEDDGDEAPPRAAVADRSTMTAEQRVVSYIQRSLALSAETLPYKKEIVLVNENARIWTDVLHTMTDDPHYLGKISFVESNILLECMRASYGRTTFIAQQGTDLLPPHVDPQKHWSTYFSRGSLQLTRHQHAQLVQSDEYEDDDEDATATHMYSYPQRFHGSEREPPGCAWHAFLWTIPLERLFQRQK